MNVLGNLYENVWFISLYNIRHKWSTAFNKEIFGMGILSTQRSESTNNICHNASKPTSTLTESFLGLENVMKAWRKNERDEDFKSEQSATVLAVKSSPVLRQGALVYTRKLYSMFEAELLHGMCGLAVECSATSNLEFYIRNLDNEHTVRPWIVKVDKGNSEITCSCKKFEMMGILCAHTLRVLNHENITKIPDKYILLRWLVHAKRDIYNNYGYKHLKDSQTTTTCLSGLIYRTHVHKFAYRISILTQGDELAENNVLETLRKLTLESEAILNGKNPQEMPMSKKKKTPNKPHNLKDPTKMRSKGVSNARLKGFWEKNNRSKRKDKEVVSSQEAFQPSNPSQFSMSDQYSQEIQLFEDPSLLQGLLLVLQKFVVLLLWWWYVQQRLPRDHRLIDFTSCFSSLQF
ncbi:protein FAR1-RELATED SEQUENCE 1-like [Phalaenopsis equestris]|uniref:protein FAR1-RELATED SEQUENCE 1-like n=1 Tax=Phalaenopsis equestris TaxID=78828 RepID=UPI0009E481FE|nr:protein FAR1-RELATED SEQUENCE 1-like [Phalaenopsis equestris]